MQARIPSGCFEAVRELSDDGPEPGLNVYPLELFLSLGFVDHDKAALLVNGMCNQLDLNLPFVGPHLSVQHGMKS